jgi:hypothetical protein
VPQSYPDLRPLYDTARSYLEIPQRINLLNTRMEVLQDMLQLLKESVSSRHSERLEQIVIVLIAIEISMFYILLFQRLSPILIVPLSPWDRYYPCRSLCIIYHPEQLHTFNSHFPSLPCVTSPSTTRSSETPSLHLPICPFGASSTRSRSARSCIADGECKMGHPHSSACRISSA